MIRWDVITYLVVAHVAQFLPFVEAAHLNVGALMAAFWLMSLPDVA
jgi:hypothetical protein